MAKKKATVVFPSKPPLSTTSRQYYKHNYLKEVIARLDFSTPIPLPASGPPRAIYESIKKRFPVAETKKSVARELLIHKEGAHEERTEKLEWLYYGKNRDKYVNLSKTHLYVAYQRHQSYDDLRSDFLTIVDAVFGAFHDVQPNRLGLRYINRVELNEPNPTEWGKYFIPIVLGIFDLADDRTTISRAFHILDFNYGETSLRFQYGMPNPDYPAPIRKKEFILDFDAYCNLQLNREEIAQYIDGFHEKINRAFEQVITDALRKKMRGKNGG